jgi:hypothetical protein
MTEENNEATQSEQTVFGQKKYIPYNTASKLLAYTGSAILD